MSHQVLISFDIDESKVQENAEKEAARQIVKDTFTSYNPSAQMSNYVKNIIEEMLESEKEVIIEKAVKEVVANLHKTKAVREKLEEGMKDV